MKNISTLSLLFIFINTLTARYFEITNATSKNFYVYDTKTNKYTKEGTNFLDFSNGNWYYLKDLDILEFHSLTSGFLNFNNQLEKFYNSIYLEGTKRVLVFPLKTKKGITNDLKPYIDKSKITGNGDQKIIEVYVKNKSRMSFSDAFNNSKFMSFIGEMQFRNLIKEWNFLPFLNPKVDGTIVGNSFNNHWGALVGFGRMLLDQMRNPCFSFKQQEQNLITFSKSELLKRLMSKLATFIYYEEARIMNILSKNQGVWLRNIKLKSLLDPMMDHLKQNNKNFMFNLTTYMEELYAIIYPLSEIMLDTYLTSHMRKYLNYYFDNFEKKGALKHNANRMQTWKEYIYDRVNMSWNHNILNTVITKINKQSFKTSEEQVKYHEISTLINKQIKAFSNFVIKFFDNEFDTIKEYIDLNDNNNFADVDSFLKFRNQFQLKDSEMRKNSKYQRRSNLTSKQTFLKKLDANVLTDLFFNLLGLDGLSQVMIRYESRSWGFSLKNWEIFGKLGMNIYNENTKQSSPFLWFRELLVMVGEVSYNGKRDKKFFKFQSFKIFAEENRII